MDIAGFRTIYPEFSNTSKYSDASVSQWLSIAGMMLNQQRWAEALDFGTGLFVAHNLALQAAAVAAASRGAAPGTQVGALSSKTAGPVSASYDTASGIEPNAGHWNLTNYGTRFIQLARWIGAGPTVV